jgi:hypothetical protein
MKYNDLLGFIKESCISKNIPHWDLHEYKNYNFLICKDDKFIELYYNDHILFYVKPNDEIVYMEQYFKYRVEINDIIKTYALSKELDNEMVINTSKQKRVAKI